MTDTPGSEPTGPEPGSEQRLPATRPPAEVAPVERFTSPPSIRAVELSPERAAQVVRQSSNARWVGFLATVIVILFVALYWFYELGAPLGLTQPRLEAEIAAQQVTAVERGYLVYEANCARCHGEQGEGGIGPVLNRQDKLFAHLNENYLKNVLTVGGRYVCGDPKSLMPAWSDTGNPPGPLNYRQIEELIAFLLATNDTTYIVRDEHLLDPKVDPQTGEVLTFTGWRDPNYLPAPGGDAVSGLLEGRVRLGRQRVAGTVRGAGSAVDRPERRGRDDHRRRDRVRPDRGDRPGRRAVHALVRQPGRRHPARCPDQGRRRGRRVQDRRVPGRREARLLGTSAGGRGVPVRLLRAPQHDGNPDRAMIDR